jgi:imidazolonepropionase-like amidohydrolase
MRILQLAAAVLTLTACHIEHHHGDGDDEPGQDPGPGPDPTPPPCDDTATIAIERVTLLSMELGSVPIPDTTVLVRDRRIAWIGPSASAPVPAGAVRIDGRGRWLVPGLVDAHVHVENPRLMRLALQEPSIDEGAIADADVLLPFIAHGVTQVGNLAAMSESIGQRRAVETGAILGPHLMLAAMVDGDPPIWYPGFTRVASTPEDGRQVVRDELAEGYDMVKVYSRLSLETFSAILEEAQLHGAKVVGHIPGRNTPIDPYFQPGYSMIAHAEELGFRAADSSDAEVARMVALAKQHGTGLMSTLTVDHRILEQTLDPSTLHTRSEIATVHPLVRRFWYERNPYVGRNSPERIAQLQQVIAFNDKVVRAFVAAGLPVLAATDALVPGVVAGPALHDELAALVAAGLTPYQALDAATRAPTAWMGVANDRGTITTGKRADLLLLDADPLADIANTRRIAGVIASGRWLPRADLDGRLAELAARYAGIAAAAAAAPRRAAPLPPVELEALFSGSP